MRTAWRVKPAARSMRTCRNFGGPKRTTGFLEKPNPSRGMPTSMSSFAIAILVVKDGERIAAGRKAAIRIGPAVGRDGSVHSAGGRSCSRENGPGSRVRQSWTRPAWFRSFSIDLDCGRREALRQRRGTARKSGGQDRRMARRATSSRRPAARWPLGWGRDDARARPDRRRRRPRRLPRRARPGRRRPDVELPR